MSLTLVQLAEAIQNDRAIEIKGGALGDVWTGADLSPICLNEIRTWLKFGHVRIKPEPRELWLIPYTDKLGYKVCETHYSQWEPEVNVAGLNFAGIIHVGEIL